MAWLTLIHDYTINNLCTFFAVPISIAVLFGVPHISSMLLQKLPKWRGFALKDLFLWYTPYSGFAAIMFLWPIFQLLVILTIAKSNEPYFLGAHSWYTNVAFVVDFFHCLPMYGIDTLGGTHKWIVLAIVFISSILLLCLGRFTHHQKSFYPLASFVFSQLGICASLWSLCIGLEELFGSIAIQANLRERLLAIHACLERCVAWFIYASLAGELWWLFAAQPWCPRLSSYCSYRVYSLWAVCHLLAIVIAVAVLLDEWEHVSQWPVRLFGITAILVALLFAVRSRIDRDICAVKSSDELKGERWFQALEARLMSILDRDDEPVILVAASGGGTRASMFASLVFEWLARTPSKNPANKDRKLADNVLFISAVSGGSLATAHFVNRGLKSSEEREARYTIFSELETRVREWLSELKNGEVPDKFIDQFGDVQNPRRPQEYSWIEQNSFTDEISMNFMAPILRGVIAPFIYRGDALTSFWKEAFNWDQSTNCEKIENGSRPLVLFNACDVLSGRHLVVGFPPLPVELSQKPTKKSHSAGPHLEPPSVTRPSTSATTANRLETNENRLEEVAHVGEFDSVFKVSLAKAVRLSSNFPWGFRPGRVAVSNKCDKKRTKSDKESRRCDRLILDGGIVDNTGFDTLAELIERLSLSERGKKLCETLKSRRTVILEIDSGAKPKGTTWLTWLLGALLEPIHALNNAAYFNADVSKASHLKKIGQWLQNSNAQSGKPDTVVECNRYRSDALDKRQVITAWTLGPKDKGAVIARFILALAKLEDESSNWYSVGTSSSKPSDS